jgi:NTP pyrophosphatase (non-canonical NTP hydrolase)
MTANARALAICQSRYDDQQPPEYWDKEGNNEVIDVQSYIDALNKFVTDHQIPRDIASRVRKANEELGEVAECAINGDIYNLESEICDMVNVAFDMLCCVTKDPFALLMENLAAKDAKYKAGNQRIEDKK